MNITACAIVKNEEEMLINLFGPIYSHLLGDNINLDSIHISKIHDLFNVEILTTKEEEDEDNSVCDSEERISTDRTMDQTSISDPTS